MLDDSRWVANAYSIDACYAVICSVERPNDHHNHTAKQEQHGYLIEKPIPTVCSGIPVQSEVLDQLDAIQMVKDQDQYQQELHLHPGEGS